MALDQAALLNDYEAERVSDSSTLNIDIATLNIPVKPGAHHRHTCTRHMPISLSLANFFSIIKIFASLAAFVILVLVLHETHGLSQSISRYHSADGGDGVWKNCGENTTEAQERGCRFDVMLGIWTHPECHDEELLNTYWRRQNFTWYEDPGLTERIPDDVLGFGNHSLIFTDRYWHFVHCGYVWDLMMRAVTSGRPVIKELYSADHTAHCTKMLVTDESPPKNVTRVYVAFSSCGFPS